MIFGFIRTNFLNFTTITIFKNINLKIEYNFYSKNINQKGIYK
jgi:hypothetical protein